MDRSRLVPAGGDEPAWAEGGSYQAVRIIRNFVERWDRTPLQEQQAHHGPRSRRSGRADGRRQHRATTCRTTRRTTKAQDHAARRAHPPGQPAHRGDRGRTSILRRPFNYSNGVTKSGQLEMGLLFICYQADLEKGFIAVQTRLDGEPLEEYIKPIGGGFFFTLPGVDGRGATGSGAA